MGALLSRRHWMISAAAVLAMPAARATARIETQLFGSPVTLLLPDRTGARLRATVMGELATMHRRWNAWKPGDVEDLNAAFRAGRPVRTTPGLLGLIRGAAALERLSGGHFNAGIGGLVGAWGFHADRLQAGPCPDAAALGRWVDPGVSLTQIDMHGLDVRSRQPTLQLDFGAYAKGVAIDLTLDRLRAEGVHDALIDLGGNLAAIGRPDRRPWRIGVRDPFGTGMLAQLTLREREAVVTSGLYERWRDAAGRPVSHIIDPRSGQPVAGLVSVTVVHPSAALADAAATALLVAGPSRWPAVAARMGVSQVLVVDRHGQRMVSPALTPRLLAA